MPRAPWWSKGGGLFLMSEETLDSLVANSKGGALGGRRGVLGIRAWARKLGHNLFVQARKISDLQGYLGHNKLRPSRTLK